MLKFTQELKQPGQIPVAAIRAAGGFVDESGYLCTVLVNDRVFYISPYYERLVEHGRSLEEIVAAGGVLRLPRPGEKITIEF